jgi:hypothetical protein
MPVQGLIVNPRHTPFPDGDGNGHTSQRMLYLEDVSRLAGLVCGVQGKAGRHDVEVSD